MLNALFKFIFQQYNLNVKPDRIHLTSWYGMPSIEDIIYISRNITYKYFDFYITYYDFDVIPDDITKKIKRKFSKFGRGDLCNWEINKESFYKYLENSDKVILISFENKDYEDETKLRDYPDTIAVGSKINKDDYCMSLLCSRQKTEVLENNNYRDLKLGTGIILMYILAKNLKEEGYKRMYIRAAHKGLIPYYEKFGFKKTDEPDNAQGIKMVLDLNSLNNLQKKSEENINKIREFYYDGRIIDNNPS